MSEEEHLRNLDILATILRLIAKEGRLETSYRIDVAGAALIRAHFERLGESVTWARNHIIRE